MKKMALGMTLLISALTLAGCHHGPRDDAPPPPPSGQQAPGAPGGTGPVGQPQG